MTCKCENSYITIEEADDYFLTRFGADIWQTLGPEDKMKALVTATKRIDNLPFVGYKCNPEQKLQFPRFFVDFTYALDFFVTAKVPQQVKDATAEEALSIVQYVDANGLEAFNGVINTDYQSLKLGDASITYGNGTSAAANASAGNAYGLLSEQAAKMLQGLIKTGFNMTNSVFYEQY